MSKNVPTDAPYTTGYSAGVDGNQKRKIQAYVQPITKPEAIRTYEENDPVTGGVTSKR